MFFNDVFDELVFYGLVAKPYLFRVEAYLQKQENALSQVAEMLLKEPDNRILRERLSSPSRLPETSFSS